MTDRLTAARACACLTLAFTLLLLAFVGTARAADFTWSSSVSTTQAGGHPNVTFNYASSSPQSLTRLDVDLPQGMMHRNNLNGACSNPLYLADNCPASSTVGTVSTQIVVARVPITVPGTIYQLSAPVDGANATFGIVLRPPLSSLGLTGKIFMRNQISFTNGGGLRSSLVGPLNTVTVLGATLPSRIAQLRLTYNAQTPSGGIALTSNPTSCKSQTFTVRGTFSDLSTADRSSGFATTGCPAVPFAPTGGVQLTDNTAGQRTSFTVEYGNAGSSSASALHFGHVVAIGHDFEEVGDFDLEAIEAGPRCAEEQAASAAGCPADSQIGEISADIEGFGTVKGKSFSTFSPGHKTISEITLRQGVTIRFPGELGGANKSTLSFSGLPQLPFTAFRFRSTRAAAWITNTCAIRTAHMIADSFSGGHVTRDIPLPKPTCPPPSAPTITSGPERGITINTSHVEYRFTGKEVDTAWECAMDDGPYEACASPFVDDWQGEGVHSFSVRAVREGVAGPATTATFSIDTIPPVVTFVGDEYADADGDGVADKPFRPDDFEYTFDATDAGSDLDYDKLDASFVSEGRPQEPSTRSVKQPRPHTQGHVQVGGAALAPPGPGTATATAVDIAGNATTIAIGLIIDSQQPEIVVNEKKRVFTDALIAEIPIVATDDSLRFAQGELTLECTALSVDGAVKDGKAKVITDRDSGRSKGFCVFEDLAEGTYKVTVRGWDPVKKESIAEGDLTVDRSAPKISLINPEDADSDGDGVADRRFRPSFFDVFTEIVDPESGIDPDGTSCLAKVKNKGNVKGNINIMPANRVTCSVVGLPDGDVDVEITARNYVGTVTIVKRGFTVDTMGPTLTFTDPYDFDSDGDGFSDGGERAARLGYEIRVEDQGIGVDPNSGACSATLRRTGGKITGSVVISNGSLRCQFEGLPAGETDIEISAADYRGHVTVLKAAVRIASETPPETPVLSILAPSAGQSITQGSPLTIVHSMVGTGPFTYRCAVDSFVVLASCPSGSSVSTVGMTLGTHVLKVVAYDSVGSYEATRAFNIAAPSGGTVCIAIYPIPPGCPGYVPPGGGGVITLP